MEFPIIRTSDRSVFRRCRRKWDLGSRLRQNLEPVPRTQGTNPNLWFGTAIHYALEDYHGFKVYPTLQKAFENFPNVWQSASTQELPNNIDELMEMGVAMLDYYIKWNKFKRVDYETHVIDGVPQVEIQFSIPYMTKSNKIFMYQGRIDRIVKDRFGKLWLLDYKTAKRFPNESQLQIDSQALAYIWAAHQLFRLPFEGIIFVHLLKELPQYPKTTKNGLSIAKNQKTSALLYKEAMNAIYVKPKVPTRSVVDFYNGLLSSEDAEGDRYIKFTQVAKTIEALHITTDTIQLEVEDMIQPNIRIYPNPMWTCAFDCEFLELCEGMTNGESIERLISTEFQKRENTTEVFPKEVKTKVID